jgi:murein DD-endopeptidase MepM/ murein hydrolase activator NlpD
MAARRYTVVVADRLTGTVRDITVSLRRVIFVTLGVLALPVLIGLGARWSARFEIEQLRANNSALEVENSSYRAATGALTSQIQALGTVVDDLGQRSTVDPELAWAMERLPAVVKARAAGGTSPAGATFSSVFSTALSSPADTFGVIRTLLTGLESRLRSVRGDVERREALAAATPSIWPAHGWLTGSFGKRPDPFSGEQGYHQGIDISAAKGQPAYATADGVVQSAAYAGEYGNMLVLAHEFGLSTRYAHLSRFNARVGDRVKRGDIIGFIGSTGRSTGWHLHYEILANGKLINPLQLLTQPSERSRRLAQ